jgi:GT2 family glycosyltransferase
MKSIELTVIILTCHRAERCHDSLRKNQAVLVRHRTEWLVVNNGADSFRLPSELPAPARLLQMPRNLGAEARNAALQEARGEYVLMLDDDAYLADGTLDQALQILKNTADAGGIMLPVENEGCLLPTVFHGCATLFRSNVLRAIGGYPKDYGYYGEEYDVTFRLIAAGHRLLPCPEDIPPVRHARDQAGRNTNRIIHRLIRNNTFCWARYLPLDDLPRAVYDTVYRYLHVARKEKALRGFVRGLFALPSALLRGLCRRTPLHPADFESVSLNAAVQQAAHSIRQKGIRRVVLCGLGKLPSGWLEILENHGLEICAVVEQNTAFHNRRFREIHIHPPHVLEDLIHPEVAFLCGTAAVSTNRYWIRRLARAGLRTNRTADPVQSWELRSPHHFTLKGIDA